MEKTGATEKTDPFHGSHSRRFLVTDSYDTDVRSENGESNVPKVCASPANNAHDSIKVSESTSEDDSQFWDNRTITCMLKPFDEDDLVTVQLMRLALVITRETESTGGLLVHGALAERNGEGIIMAGPGGVGKTTASSRLVSPWHSLSDDTTLVVLDTKGVYQAHPWPTWSRFMSDGPGGHWDVQRAVPLKAIFFLSQSNEDRIEPIGTGKTAGRLFGAAQEASWIMSTYMLGDEYRTYNLQRFNTAGKLARTIPAYNLHLSLTGKFWREIERALGWNQS